MSLTVHQSPATYTPSDNPIEWTFSSDETTQPNFRYLVKVFINDVQVSTEQVFPENGIYGKYNAMEYASINCNKPPINGDLVFDAANYCRVKITVVENYGITPADHDTETTSNVVAFKAALTWDHFIDWDPADYMFGTGAKFLTNFPEDYAPKVAQTGEEIRLMLINDLNSVNMLFKLYTSAGVLINSATYGFASSALRIIIMNISPDVIINESFGINAGDFDTCAYYTVEDTTDTEVYRIDIDRDCKYSTYKRVHFLSAIGSIESFSFGLISRKSSDIKSMSFTRSKGVWNGSQYEYRKQRGTDIDYMKNTDNFLECESDFIPEQIQHWLFDNLFKQPCMWLEENGILTERKITNTSTKPGIAENDMLLNVKIMIQMDSENSMVL